MTNETTGRYAPMPEPMADLTYDGVLLTVEQAMSWIDATCALRAAQRPVCQTCNGVGLIGGHSGQTPESYQEHSEDCPDCTPQRPADLNGLTATDVVHRNIVDMSSKAAQDDSASPAKLWIWQNFVGGRPEYWAFDNPFPINMNDGDPQTLGEPCGYALVKPSRNGRPDVAESEVLRRIAIASRPVPPPISDAVDVLAELIACNDLKERAEGIEFAGPLSQFGDDWETKFLDMRDEYIRRQSLAWDKARAIIAASDAQWKGGVR